MNDQDIRHRAFTYLTTTDGTVLIRWRDRLVVTVGGAAGRRLNGRLMSADPGQLQALLARATGNFKRGNER